MSSKHTTGVVEIEETEVTVDFNYYPPEPMTRDYPGAPADIEVDKIHYAEGTRKGEEIPKALWDRWDKYFHEELETACWEELERLSKDADFM